MIPKKKILDGDGIEVTDGCTVCFSYGIPPVHVVAPVIYKNGKLVAMTIGHSQAQCEVRHLEKHVGYFYVSRKKQ